jgi:purine nucleosidase
VTRLLLDTDIGTDADDAIALALALRHPDIDLRAVTTVSGDTQRRAAIARKLLRLAGRDDVVVAAGIGPDGPAPVAGAWVGHEGEGLLEAGADEDVAPDAIELLLRELGTGEVELATIGPQTNVAAALDRDHELADRVRHLTVMGGAFAPIEDLGSIQPPSADHNLGCDPDASVGSLNRGLPTLYVPLDVTAPTYLTHDDVDVLRAGDELCRAVAGLIDVWERELRRLTQGRYPQERAVALHDPLAVACIVERSFVTVERLPVTVVAHGGYARTFVDPLEGREADVVTSVDVAALRRFVLETLRG